MSSYFLKPKHGTITQGTIFNCAISEQYDGCKVYGLIITARCDIEQSKIPVVNYLPIVSFDDWIHHDGREIICKRLIQSNLGKMRSCLKSAGIADTLLLTETPGQILSTLLQNQGANKKISNAATRFKDLIDERHSIDKCLSSNPSEYLFLNIVDIFPKDREALIKELISDKLNGFYFLRSSIPDSENEGFVVLVREVQRLPWDIAERLASGLTANEYNELSTSNPRSSSCLCFEFDNFAMPLALLSSPYIEHLLQTFSLTFCRIGLPDLHHSYLDNLWQTQPSVSGAKKCAS